MAVMNRAYWVDMLDRAVKTAAQAALLVLGAEQVNVMSVDWLDVAGFAGGGALLSVLTTLATGVVRAQRDTGGG